VTYRIILRASARRALTDTLPASVAPAVAEFIYGPLAENPKRVGSPLSGPYEGYYGARRGSYRILYRIVEDQVVVEVIKVDHRRDAYRA
jgi:mRNA-degrading endonuclease RelE of RelBE toxin-antitoxin system